MKREKKVVNGFWSAHTLLMRPIRKEAHDRRVAKRKEERAKQRYEAKYANQLSLFSEEDF